MSIRAAAALRRVPVFGLWGLIAFVAVGALGFQLHRESRRHRASAEQMLQDCTSLAAGDYAYRLGMMLDTGVLFPARLALLDLHGDAVPARDELATDRTQTMIRRLARSFFRFERDSGELAFGDEVDVLDRAWVAEAVRNYVETLAPTTYDVEMSVQPRDEGFGLLICHVERTPEGFGNEVVGVLCVWDDFAPIFGALLENSGTVAAPLSARGEGEVFTFGVLDVHGARVYSSGDHAPGAIVQRAEMAPRHGGLAIEAGLDRSWSADLLSGGLPRSRVVDVVLLSAMALLPLLAAFHLLSRERQVARNGARFVSSVSHELRTPLAQIRLFAETLLLRRVRSADDERRALEVLDAEARRLENLVENVLQFARAERRALAVHPQRLELEPIVAATVAEYRALAAAREASIELRADGPSVARADPAAVRTILLNLLDNAVKYGPRGQKIRVALDDRAGGALLSVEDDGPGVDEQHAERVWERFWRSPDLAEVSTGAGIGLALVQELAVLQGAEASVTRATSGGARFAVLFPPAAKGELACASS